MGLQDRTGDTRDGTSRLSGGQAFSLPLRLTNPPPLLRIILHIAFPSPATLPAPAASSLTPVRRHIPPASRSTRSRDGTAPRSARDSPRSPLPPRAPRFPHRSPPPPAGS